MYAGFCSRDVRHLFRVRELAFPIRELAFSSRERTPMDDTVATAFGPFSGSPNPTLSSDDATLRCGPRKAGFCGTQRRTRGTGAWVGGTHARVRGTRTLHPWRYARVQRAHHGLDQPAKSS